MAPILLEVQGTGLDRSLPTGKAKTELILSGIIISCILLAVMLILPPSMIGVFLTNSVILMTTAKMPRSGSAGFYLTQSYICMVDVFYQSAVSYTFPYMISQHC